MIKKKNTIKDIARMAGVSKGTVDRVLHKRGKVSKTALAKVEKILKEIDFHPNPIARNLKENKVYKICVLIPDDKIDVYWTPAHEGIYEAQKEFIAFGLVVEKFLYHPHNKQDFHKKSMEAIKVKPDLLLMTPLFEQESFQISQTCKEEKIRVALFNNHLNTKTTQSFIGQDLVQSGKIAANLIDKILPSESDIGIIHIDKEPHLLLKEQGFKEYYINQECSHRILDAKDFNSDNQDRFKHDVKQYIRNNPNVAALFITNSKVYMIAEILSKLPKSCVLVGYDLVPKNVSYLKEGKLDFLIHQRPKEQAYLSINYFAEFFLFGKNVPLKNLLPIDIITAQNVDYYLNQSSN
ncbi:LacI family DNA-binding transcriptional regulator [uncultured Zobellia sp.]|uniref:LacI family DNA-binding transcriptional regulator n=1 Tax=uncultured Zobellia sp. TaxID=255433 RepID=UPI0025949004|nr:LacI family DNA-binding transcriptional regulator [uncultured Zobellia sp.]